VDLVSLSPAVRSDRLGVMVINLQVALRGEVLTQRDHNLFFFKRVGQSLVDAFIQWVAQVVPFLDLGADDGEPWNLDCLVVLVDHLLHKLRQSTPNHLVEPMSLPLRSFR
jgi:hypothetical protein